MPNRQGGRERKGCKEKEKEKEKEKDEHTGKERARICRLGICTQRAEKRQPSSRRCAFY
jgi:hypothetical protein